MKVSSDDIITKKIKEVMEQYEPDYSPQFWENIRKQRPIPESLLITLLLRYKYWLSVLAFTGVLLMIYMVSDLQPAGKNSITAPLSPSSLNYSLSEEAIKTTNSEKTTAAGNSDSYNSYGREEKNIISKVMPAMTIDNIPAENLHNIPAENKFINRAENIEKASGSHILLSQADSGFHLRTQKLIPTEYRDEEIKLTKSQVNDKKGEIEFHWPDFHSLITKDEGYNKFVGPNKLALYYSPEIHFSDSVKTIGVSQGIGINFEGPLRSLISISAGLSYQSIKFDNKTSYSGKVPPPGPFQPGDTIRTFYYIDSTEIRSGSYSFFEVPVSLNFKFLETTRSEVWLSTGISSISFLRQEYTYETLMEGISESSSISLKAWKNIHPLASLNFSLFYRYNYSDRFLIHGLIQYKQHLDKLGYNSMKLNRLNLQIGLTYHFGSEN